MTLVSPTTTKHIGHSIPEELVQEKILSEIRELAKLKRRIRGRGNLVISISRNDVYDALFISKRRIDRAIKDKDSALKRSRIHII